MFLHHLCFLQSSLSDPGLVAPAEAIVRALPLSRAMRRDQLVQGSGCLRYERAFFVALAAPFLDVLGETLLRFRIPLEEPVFNAFGGRRLRSLGLDLTVH